MAEYWVRWNPGYFFRRDAIRRIYSNLESRVLWARILCSCRRYIGGDKPRLFPVVKKIYPDDSSRVDLFIRE